MFWGKSIGVVCHQASLLRDRSHLLDQLLPLHRAGTLRVAAVFGPQHGIWGHTQDNMIEWEGYTDPRTGLRFYSLYGAHREPTAGMLEGVEELVFDVQDVGARYYTFIWTLANCLAACERAGVPVTVLDRPNPIRGDLVEGMGHSMEYRSFVGMYPLPVRHGLTVGEVGLYLRDKYFPKCELRVVGVERWTRGTPHRLTGMTWGMPSPNMPTVDTALVYPGMCLLEGTKLSEGRGTTRPFEIFGAPFMDGWELCDAMNGAGLAGCWFRPVQFLPTFQKHGGVVCQGAFLHVTDEVEFRPVLTAAVLLSTVGRLYGGQFEWQDPPYEYEYEKLPIDILAGGTGFREGVEAGWGVERFREWIDADGAELAAETSGYRIY